MAILNYNEIAAIFKPIFDMPSVSRLSRIEAVIYMTAENYSKDYSGGQWETQQIGDYTYLLPQSSYHGLYRVVNGDNYFEGTMDAATYGVALTLMLYNRMLWENHDALTDEAIMHFHTLKDNAYDNLSPEQVSAIAAFLD